ncbi:MAG: LPS assembly lipoprotein LptE [Nitrococcus sp.]|nr:LPS assembly lipoprotein LptE [Nitrococcus sp.]
MSRWARHGLWMFVEALLVVSLLSGCGWHLRGSTGSALSGGDLEDIKVYLAPEMGEGALTSAAADTLRGYGAQVVSDPQAADWVLDLLDQQTDRRTVSVTRQGQARAYELHYVLRFGVHSGAGVPLLGAQTVATQVVYQTDPQNILGRESQERRLLEQLRQHALELMMARLARIPSESGKAVPGRGADSP